MTHILSHPINPFLYIEKQIGLLAIRFYQRYISPYKGFCCAYKAYTGHASCSAVGYRLVRKHGLFASIALIRERTQLCGVAYRRYAHPSGRLNKQKGECDIGCCAGGLGWSSSSISGADNDALEFLNCACPCDFLSTKKGKEKNKYVYVPPNVKRERLKIGFSQPA